MDTSTKTFGHYFWTWLPAVTSLCVIFLPIILFPLFPRGVAIFIVLYVFSWFFFVLEYTFFFLIAFYKTRKSGRVDWSSKLAALQENGELTAQERSERARLISRGDWLSPEQVVHLVIIATCGEDVSILRESFGSLSEADYDQKQMYVCLATEARKKESGRQNAQMLEQEFGRRFGRFFWAEHPADISGEVRGKGANITYSGKTITAVLEKEGIDLSKVIVTTLDADNKVDRQYFSALTYFFCLQEKRQQKSYQPLPLFYNNIWDVPFLNRLVAISSGFWHMIVSGRVDRLRNFAAHAQPLLALKAMGFWDVTTIVEDSRQFWRSYLYFRGDYEVVPIFVPIYQDAVLNKSYYRSLLGQYQQTRRWAWGCSHIPFCAFHFWKLRNALPLWKTLRYFITLIHGFIMWSTAAIFIAVSYPVSRFPHPHFGETILGNNMEYLLQIFFKTAIIGIFIAVFVSLVTLPKASTWKKRWSLIWQWGLLPLSTILMGAIPALEAQIRLACGKPLEFNVTEKVRKKDFEIEAVTSEKHA